MKTATRSEPGAPRLSVQDAERDLAAARAELAELQARASGSIEHQTMRREQHTVVRQTGAVEVVAVDVPAVEVEQVGALGRLVARRALADVRDRVALAELALEEARAVAGREARAARAQAITAGEQVVRRELPALIAELRAVHERLSRLAARLDELDAPIGAAYFAHRSPAFLMQQIEVWLDGMAEAFPAERR